MALAYPIDDVWTLASLATLVVTLLTNVVYALA